MTNVPLSAQQEAFLAWMRVDGKLRHPVPVNATIQLVDRLDPDVFAGSLAKAVARHEALRTVFRFDPDVCAVVMDNCQPDVRMLDASHSATGRAIASQLRDEPFDLDHGPLVRAALIDVGPDGQILFLAVHHLVFDAWSMGVLLWELGVFASAAATGRPAKLADRSPLTATEVIRRSRDQWPDTRDHWAKLLERAPDGIGRFPGRRPTDRLSPRSYRFQLHDELVTAVRAMARRHRASNFMVLLACWAAVLSSWSGETDLLLMSPVAGRGLPGSEAALGCLFSSLFLRIDLRGQPDFPELLSRVRDMANRCNGLADYPYAEFAMDVPNTPCFAYYDIDVPAHFPGLESRAVDLPDRMVDDLEVPGANRGVPHLAVYDHHDAGWSARLAYNASAFDESTVRDLADEFVFYAENVCEVR